MTPRHTAALRIDQQFEPYPDVHFDDDDLPRRRLPGVRLGCVRGRGRRRPRHGRGRRSATSSRPTTSARSSTRSWPRARSRAARSRPSATPRSRRSSCSDGRYLNDRLATYLIPTALDAPRIESILVEAPFSGAPHGAKGVGELPMDVGAPRRRRRDPRRDRRLDPRPAGDARADPRRAPRIGSSAADAAPPPAAVESAVERRRSPDRAGPDPRPDAPTDPQPLRGGPPDGSTDGHPARSRVVNIRLLVNGAPVEVDVPGMRRLLDVLREDLGLTGTKEGCGEGECGACSVLLDGQVVDACLVPVCQVDGSDGPDGRGPRSPAAAGPGRLGARRLQQAFLEAGGAQCGICTPGMLMAARAYLDAGGGPDEARSARRSPATSAAARATRRSSTRSRSPLRAAVTDSRAVADGRRGGAGLRGRLQPEAGRRFRADRGPRRGARALAATTAREADRAGRAADRVPRSLDEAYASCRGTPPPDRRRHGPHGPDHRRARPAAGARARPVAARRAARHHARAAARSSSAP